MWTKSVKRVLSIIVISLIMFMEMSSIMPTVISASTSSSTPKLTSRAHAQTYGWLKEISVSDKVGTGVIGTTGESKRLESLEINIDAPDGVTLKYRAHVQGYGWMKWVTADNKVNKNFIGTTGESKRMEAIQIVVEGLEDYVVKYRTHVQTYGWLEWITAGNSTNNMTPVKGNFAGTQGESKRMEALEIIIVPVNKEKVEEQPKADVTQKQNSNVEEQPNTSVTQNENSKVENQVPQTEIQPESKPQIQLKKQVAKDHVHNFTDWKVEVQVTCVTQGLETRTCTECGAVESKVIQSHELIRAEYNDVKATCEQRGQEHYICKLCKQQFFHYTPMLGHIWADNRVVDKEPTCTENGYESIHCTREGCTHTKDVKVLSAIGHNFKTVQTEATCLEDGVIKTVCTKCGDVKESKITQRRLGHNFTNYEDNHDATCTADGTKTAKCTRCEQKSTVINKGSKLNHDYEETILIPATCTESGRVKKVCKNCGDTKESVVSAKGHEWKVISRNSSCTGSVTETVCEGCGEAKSVTCHTYGTGHTWNKDGTRCTVCNIYAPKWTNSWCSDVYLPTLAKVLKLEGCRTPGTSANDYNSLTAQGRIRLEEELKKADKTYNPHSHIRIVWFVYYTSDLRECEGYDGKANIYRNVITADWKFEQKAPKAKEGYEFTGWVDALSGEKVSDDMLKADSNGEKTILVNTWKDMDKTFKPTYKKVK